MRTMSPTHSLRSGFLQLQLQLLLILRNTLVARLGDRSVQGVFFTLPFPRTLRQLGSIVCAALILAACSSGGGDEGGGTSPAASSSSGTFVDSPVQGLGYRAL